MMKIMIMSDFSDYVEKSSVTQAQSVIAIIVDE